MNFRAVLALPKTAGPAQTHKIMSFIWIVWSTWYLDELNFVLFQILEEDRTRFLDRVGDAGGGQYIINAKHILTELAASTIENIIMERYGSKTLRIFRVIRQKQQCEESMLQSR